jgi:hypothetical protein
LSVEGGIRGTQRRLVCPKCGKVFFAWRPDEQPGAKVKCYFCRHEFEDEAARRAAQPAAPPGGDLGAGKEELGNTPNSQLPTPNSSPS